MDFTITLTDAQYKSLSYVAYDPQEWIENAVYERCRIAGEEIYNNEVQKLIEEGKPISKDKNEVIMNADIKSAKEIEDSRIKFIEQN